MDSQNPKKSVTDTVLASRVGRAIGRMAREDQFSGAVLICRSGKDLFRRAYGPADRTWNIRNTPQTRFRIASVGKMFTAAAVLQLIEAGKLALGTHVVHYLGLKGTNLPAGVTIRHLLTMTSGIADWINEDGQDANAEWAAFCRRNPIYLLRQDSEYLPFFSQLEPYGPPGESFRYNNAGFILLGLVIEKAAGLSYFDYVRRNIFARAGMARTDFLDLDDCPPDVAEGYFPIRDGTGRVTGWRRNIYFATAGPAADGGATSTLDDLVRFSRALRSGRLVSKELVETMLSPQVSAEREGHNWMYGQGCFLLVDDDRNVVRWGHTGEEEGISCRLYYYPEQKLDVILLGNQSSCAGRAAAAVHSLIVGDG